MLCRPPGRDDANAFAAQRIDDSKNSIAAHPKENRAFIPLEIHSPIYGIPVARSRPKREWLETGSWEVEIAGERFPAKVQFPGICDPKGERIKAESK
jgi:hypothetical protein